MRSMTEKLIPDQIDPFRYAEQSLRISGVVHLADMPRLAENAEKDGVVAAELAFGKDEQGVVFLKGHLETELTLTCQRCMEPFNYGIMADFVLGIVNTLAEADTLPEHYEPALVQEGSLALRALIEDEVILNLPIIPRHAPQDCKVKMPLSTIEGGGAGRTENPFHVLASLKHKQK